jgi:S-ribosylhomocysteine lyase LuxS involved in autoinducer biosynthesis
MSLQEWSKFMRAVKEADGLTNKEIEERTNYRVSLKTIEHIMAMKCDRDIMRDTSAMIENAILGASTSYPCYLAFEENLPEVSQRVSNALRDLERDLDNKHIAALDELHNSHAAEMLALKVAHTAELNAQQEDCNAKIQYLRDQITRLQRDNDNLWNEITRKARIIDRLIDMQETSATNK